MLVMGGGNCVDDDDDEDADDDDEYDKVSLFNAVNFVENMYVCIHDLFLRI